MTAPINPTLISCAGCASRDQFVPLFSVVNGYDPRTPLKIVNCPNCGLCFINPQYPAAAYADYYQNRYYSENKDVSIEQIYRATHGHRGAFFHYFEKFARELPPGGAYLDAGAGTGQWLDFLHEAAPPALQASIHALEPSNASTEFILRRYPDVIIQKRTLEGSEYPAAFFDCVLCSALIEHFTDPLDSLLRINRMMRQGGHLMLLTPNLDEHSFAKGPANFFKFVHTFYYTQDTLTSLLNKAGFEVSSSNIHYDPAFTWYSFIIVVARKMEERSPADLSVYRRKTAADVVNAEDTRLLLKKMQSKLGLFRRKFYVMYLKRNLKATVLRLVRGR